MIANILELGPGPVNDEDSEQSVSSSVYSTYRLQPKDSMLVPGILSRRLSQQQISDAVDSILKRVRIEKDESSRWNCQSWALDGFYNLVANPNLFSAYYNREAVKSWLQTEPGRTPTPTSSRPSSRGGQPAPAASSSSSRPPS